jgi:hypothetical protein
MPSSWKYPNFWARYTGAWYGVACLPFRSSAPPHDKRLHDILLNQSAVNSKILPVHQESNLVSRHLDIRSCFLPKAKKRLGYLAKGGGESMSFR